MNVLYVQYANLAAYPPAMRVGRVLRDAGHRISYLGLSVGDGGGLTWPEDLADTARWVRHGRLAPLRFLLAFVRTIRRFRPDWVYVADPMTAFLIRPVIGLHRGGVAYHEHDMPVPSANPRQKRIWVARNKFAAAADLVTVPNAERAVQMDADVDGPKNSGALTVWNTPCRAEIGPALDGSDSANLRLVYAGTINRKLVPLALIQALTLAERVELTVIGYETQSSVGYGDEFLRFADRHGVGDRVRFLGPMPHHSLPAELRRHDVAFAALPDDGANPNYRTLVGASNKCFNGLAQGLPLMVGPGADWREYFVNPGYAAACDPADPESMAKTLNAFGADRAATRSMGEAGRQRLIRDWSFEAQFAPVIRRMSEKVEIT